MAEVSLVVSVLPVTLWACSYDGASRVGAFVDRLATVLLPVLVAFTFTQYTPLVLAASVARAVAHRWAAPAARARAADAARAARARGPLPLCERVPRVHPREHVRRDPRRRLPHLPAPLRQDRDVRHRADGRRRGRLCALERARRPRARAARARAHARCRCSRSARRRSRASAASTTNSTSRSTACTGTSSSRSRASRSARPRPAARSARRPRCARGRRARRGALAAHEALLARGGAATGRCARRASAC